jgi:hypothetical protein
MTCERCGREIPENVLICPSCRAVTASARILPDPTTTYGTYPDDRYRDDQDPSPNSTYEQGYSGDTARTDFTEESPQAAYTYETYYHPPPIYQAPSVHMAMNNYAAARKANSSALIAEILFSLFGIYGIGWRMAGEKTTGTILLVCSFVIIWPLAISIAIFSFGFGILLCDLPLAITGIIINAVVLNNTLNRKTLPHVYSAAPPVQPQTRRTPPQ